MVLFRRLSFRVDDNSLRKDVIPAITSDSKPQQDGALAGIVRWVAQLRFEIAGRTCWIRWQMRRTAEVSRHRAIAFLGRELSKELDWRGLVKKFARATLGSDIAVENAAALGTAEER
jgi:hypothetical protein